MKMYSMPQVMTATFFGGPIAAGILISRNYKHLGIRDKVNESLIWALVGTVLLITIGLFLPTNFPNTGIALISMAIVGTWYSKTQDEYFKEYKEMGGVTGSWWIALGVGLGCMVAIVVLLIGILMLLPESFFL